MNETNNVIDTTSETSPDAGNVEKSENNQKLVEMISELKYELEAVKNLMANSAEAEKKAREEAAANSVRAKAAECSSGKLEGACDNLFSPDEVRAMSRAEVKKNLTKIKESMQRWH